MASTPFVWHMPPSFKSSRGLKRKQLQTLKFRFDQPAYQHRKGDSLDVVSWSVRNASLETARRRHGELEACSLLTMLPFWSYAKECDDHAQAALPNFAVRRLPTATGSDHKTDKTSTPSSRWIASRLFRRTRWRRFTRLVPQRNSVCVDRAVLRRCDEPRQTPPTRPKT